MRQRLSGWGRYPAKDCTAHHPTTIDAVATLARSSTGISRGAGRAYGDAALSDGDVILATFLDRILAFDRDGGVLRVEAGVTISDALSVIVPAGWFLPVVPGTAHVTFGGAVAADIHGKNQHHTGNFGSHVRQILLQPPDRDVPLTLAPGDDAFAATIGGMGLTGTILEVEVSLKRVETPYVVVEHRRTGSLHETIELLCSPSYADEYTVAWVDTMASGLRCGRGVAMRGHHADKTEAISTAPTGRPKSPLRVPNAVPQGLLNHASIRAFNALYAWREGRRGRFLSPYSPFFFPLDRLADWNRLYGRSGFLQYQFLVPEDNAEAVILDVLRCLRDHGALPFLSVLKRFGDARSPGLLSFPAPGVTLAMDLPIRDLDRLLEGVRAADELLIAAGGRVYLAKDACLDEARFSAMYPHQRIDEFKRIKRQLDPKGQIRSLLSDRIGITGRGHDN